MGVKFPENNKSTLFTGTEVELCGEECISRSL